VAVLRW